MRRVWLTLIALAALAIPCDAWAHGTSAALLRLHEVAPGVVAVLWKTPAAEGQRPDLVVTLSPGCTDTDPRVEAPVPFGVAVRWTVRCAGGLAGTTVAVRGLDRGREDVILQVTLSDQTHLTAALRADAPELVIPTSPTGLAVARSYVALGVEHIAEGLDHLAFVLGLVLLVGANRRLLAAVTAFTLAHSITLALASLRLVLLPARLVEALIALSIVLLAVEIVELPPSSGARRSPWAFAFGFGLLHGFGFARGLADIGLPANDIPVALLSFNVGVELGQLGFVALVLLAGACLQGVLSSRLRLDRRSAAYAIGALGAFWTCQRVNAFWS